MSVELGNHSAKFQKKVAEDEAEGQEPGQEGAEALGGTREG